MQVLRRRLLEGTLKEQLSRFPAVALLGPRQCGKTTLAKALLPEWDFLDLERASDRSRVEGDVEHFLESHPRRVVFDEAQLLPALFSALRPAIDQRRAEKGRFLLLGSANPSLVKGISESLAGRVGFVEMTGLRLCELRDAEPSLAIERHWERGSFPEPALMEDPADRRAWYEAYLRALLERDLAKLGLRLSRQALARFTTMLSHTHGGLWNASQLAASLGVSYHTVNSWLEVLEQVFLVRILRPFYANIGKRLVKHPKVYFRDHGLLHHLWNAHALAEIETRPQCGLSWEGMLLEEILFREKASHPGSRFHFWRTATGEEADLLIERGADLIAVEIRMHSAPGLGDLSGLTSCLEALKLPRGYVVHRGASDYALGAKITALAARSLDWPPAAVSRPEARP